MTRPKSLAHTVVCPTCGASVGDVCRYSGSGGARRPHSARKVLSMESALVSTGSMLYRPKASAPRSVSATSKANLNPQTKMTEKTRNALSKPCTTCKAAPGELCVYPHGPSYTFHRNRYKDNVQAPQVKDKVNRSSAGEGAPDTINKVAQKGSELVWEAPPPAHTRLNMVERVLPALKEREGQWAYFGVYRAGGVEATARKIEGVEITSRVDPELPDTHRKYWLRWVGTGDDAPHRVRVPVASEEDVKVVITDTAQITEPEDEDWRESFLELDEKSKFFETIETLFEGVSFDREFLWEFMVEMKMTDMTNWLSVVAAIGSMNPDELEDDNILMILENAKAYMRGEMPRTAKDVVHELLLR